MITDIIKKCELEPDTTIADIGAGTGILTRKLLEQHKDYKYTQQYKEIKSILEKEKMEYAINMFFQDKKYEEIILRNDIQYDKETFKGYNLSKSYSLRSTDNKYEEYIKSFEELFEKYQIDGVINISNCVCGY